MKPVVAKAKFGTRVDSPTVLVGLLLMVTHIGVRVVDL